MNNITNLEGALREFDELLTHYKHVGESTNHAVNSMRRKPNHVLEAEIKSFITQVWQASRSQAIEEVRGITISMDPEVSHSKDFADGFFSAGEQISDKLSELKTKE